LVNVEIATCNTRRVLLQRIHEYAHLGHRGSEEIGSIFLPFVETARLAKAFEGVEFEICDAGGRKVVSNTLEPLLLFDELNFPIAIEYGLELGFSEVVTPASWLAPSL
jgi:hypothetical protein